MSDQPTVEEFAEEARAFLDAHAELRVTDAKPFTWGDGDDDLSLFEEVDREAEQVQIAEAKRWRAARYDAGFGWITGPTEYGGRGLGKGHERAYASLESRYVLPKTNFFGIGLGMVAPTILAHAQDHVKARYLPKMYRGDLIGAQLFSEPGAGSDLASLTTKAERDGDEWIITGQKVWTSGAHYSDIGEVICRTDPDLPKHRGLTGFVIDMHAPGVEVRPLRQMTGGAAFNEVFFDGLRVPDDHRLGDVNGGWAVALTTLLNERASIGAGSGGGGLGGLGNAARLIEMLRHFDLDRDPLLRQELAAVYSGFQVAKWNGQRAMDKVKAGQAPGPELSGAKLSLTRNLQAVAEFAGHVLGPRMVADTGEWGTYAWGQFVCGVPGMRVAGGTDEVLKKIISEQVLGLPKDVGIDTTSPFKDLPKS
ncbi:MAG: acyl-CoA dehydrogenase family protein [Acidimicrobiales bacterium]|jgi:alkylation response protein AidB-like acyl-CoA dehydrogenase|nr:acyl-CoA dehydrogenase family protein [Acidimicrobiales bacterium]